MDMGMDSSDEIVFKNAEKLLNSLISGKKELFESNNKERASAIDASLQNTEDNKKTLEVIKKTYERRK